MLRLILLGVATIFISCASSPINHCVEDTIAAGATQGEAMEHCQEVADGEQGSASYASKITSSVPDDAPKPAKKRRKEKVQW